MIAASSVVLSNLAYVAGAVVLMVVLSLVVVARHRRPRSVEANVETFHRGLRALAPEDAEQAAERGRKRRKGWTGKADVAPLRASPAPARSSVHPGRSGDKDAASPPGEPTREAHG